jgi:hypothetical protein
MNHDDPRLKAAIARVEQALRDRGIDPAHCKKRDNVDYNMGFYEGMLSAQAIVRAQK